MIKLDSISTRAVFSLLLIIGLLNMPIPAYSQEDSFQNLIQNGGFEDGFQEGLGVGYDWGAFSNGNAAVGWNADSWDKVVVAGQNAQAIEIQNATEQNRYAGIYQTVSVVPGKQYKLTLKGLIRSDEGDIQLSNYGYRLQYGVDYEGGTAWELLSGDDWVEIQWDEQPLSEPPGGTYRFDSFETTLTARGDKLTLFIRGWKKWVNDGTGIFNIDEVSLVGPAPETISEPAAQVAAVDSSSPSTGIDLAINEISAPADTDQSQTEDQTGVLTETEAEPQTETSTETDSASQADTSVQTEAETTAPTRLDSKLSPQPESSTQTDTTAPPAISSQLPVSGEGKDDSITYIILSGTALLLVLVVGAISATRRQQN
jgi:hypothetical protein